MRWLLACLLVGCAANVAFDPAEVEAVAELADGDGRCAGVPDHVTSTKFRHRRSRLVSKLGGPRHRGVDLIAAASDEAQVIGGTISYSRLDKALEDEDVDVFACADGAWTRIGGARTDDDGDFALTLTGSARLPVGLRDLYVAVGADGTGARFVGLVATDGTQLVASDVDGTLTSSENAFIETVVLGHEAGVQPGAAAALQALAAKGYQLVYVTARGQQFTAATRAWLEQQGFPRGPLRLARSFVTLPGGDTVDYKTQTLGALAATLPLVAGVGNRGSDITAYTNAGLAPARIFIATAEYADEVLGPLAAGQAVGFATYDALRTGPIGALP